MDPLTFIERIREHKPCCVDSACTLKIYRHFRTMVDHDDITKSQNLLIATLDQGRMCVTDKGGSESTILEMIFSICRMLGLRPLSLEVAGIFIITLVIFTSDPCLVQ